MMKLNSDYWENRYLNDDAAWDAKKITTPIKTYVDQIKDKSLKILIPGGGNSYEFEYLFQHGFNNSFVLDYAKTPIENIQKRLPNCDENRLICEDFFEHQSQYDLIIEQTFFCALDVELRAEYVRKMHSLLLPKGKLVGLLFQFPLTESGPPFGGSKAEYLELFSEYF